MKEDKRIDNYFDRVKQNPPLQSIDKMHALLANADVKTGIKVEKVHRKWIKFILMTTLLAIIIVAFLIWPKAEETKPKNQTQNLVEIHEPMEIKIEDEISFESEKEVKTEDEEIFRPQKKPIEHLINEKHKEEEYVVRNKKSNPESEEKQVIIDPDTIQTIDGKPFIINADQALLEKLGFVFVGKSVFYQNKSTDGAKTMYNNYVIEIEEGTQWHMKNLYYGSLEDSIHTNSFDFYPVVATYRTGTIESYVYGIFNEPVEMANDTLLPIQIQSGILNNNPNDIILWFKISDNLKTILQDSNHPLLKNNNYIMAKRLKPEKNYIDYTLDALFDPSQFIELNENELLNIGFEITQEKQNSPHRNDTVQNFLKLKFQVDTIGIETKYGKWNRSTTRYPRYSSDSPELTLLLVTKINGDFFETFKTESELDFSNLIPLFIPNHYFDSINSENLVFWFQPNDILFEKLPKTISKQLQIEYNYIVAEDKSTLEKPECVYFEECKNTLKVEDFKVFPNPAKTHASVSFNLQEAIEGKISLVDLTGREKSILQPQAVLMKGEHRFNLDLSDVSEGIYLITLYSDSGVQTKRLIVSR